VMFKETKEEAYGYTTCSFSHWRLFCSQRGMYNSITYMLFEAISYSSTCNKVSVFSHYLNW